VHTTARRATMKRYKELALGGEGAYTDTHRDATPF
jgi:hypothetical protein